MQNKIKYFVKTTLKDFKLQSYLIGIFEKLINLIYSKQQIKLVNTKWPLTFNDVDF